MPKGEINEQEGGASKSDYELLYKMLLVVTPYGGDERGYGVSLLEQLPDSKVVKNMGGTVTSRELNADAREKMLKTFKKFIKTFKITTGSDIQIVPQLIEKLKQAGMETEAGVINQLQEICTRLPCPSGERRVKKKQLKQMASTYLQELGFEEADIMDSSKLLKTLQSIIKVPMGQGFWRLVSKSADKADPAVANPFFDTEGVDEDDVSEIGGTEFQDFSSVLNQEPVKTPQDDDWTFEDLEGTDDVEEARQIPTVEDIPETPKLSFWQKAKRSIGIKPKKDVVEEDDDLLPPDDLPPVGIDFSTPNQLSLRTEGDESHESVIVDPDGTIHRAKVSGPKPDVTKKRKAKTRDTGDDDEGSSESGSQPVTSEVSTPKSTSLGTEEDPIDMNPVIVDYPEEPVSPSAPERPGVKKQLRSGIKADSAELYSEEMADAFSGSKEEAPIKVKERVEPSGKKYMTIEIMTDKDMTVRTHDRTGDTPEYYFDVLSKEITGEA